MQARFRAAVDFDGDLFICYGATQYDALNIMHTGLHSDPGIVNLHWTYLNQAAINSSTVSVTQLHTDYGVRLFHVITGTNTTAGGYFAYDGSGPADINVTNGAAYTAVLWIRGTVGIGTSMKLEMVNASESVTFNLTADWQKVTLNFTPTLTTTGFKITKNTSATNVTFDATGFMVVSGSSAPAGFNVGNLSNRYDVITESVRSLHWKLGYRQSNTTMPAEGEAELEVNNDDRRYSPENASSPLYGAMEQERRLTIDVWRPGSETWVRKFAGWTVNYQPSYGKIAEHYTTIKADQGMRRLREIKYRKPTAQTVTADQLIYDVILNGYVSAVTPLQMPLDNSKLNAGYLVDPAAIMALDTGISQIPLSGEAWGKDDNAAKVIETVLKVEQGWFFIDGGGVVRFLNRRHYADPTLTPATVAFDLDFQAVSGAYVHAKEFKNWVRVTYYPSTTRDNVTVWQTREPIKLLPRGNKEVEVRFEYEEGKQIEVLTVNAFGAGVNDSVLSATNKAGVDKTNMVRADFQQVDGRSGKLKVYNITPTNLISVELKGTIKESFGGQVAEAISDSANQSGAKVESVSSKLIIDAQVADNLANYILSKYERAIGEFNSISLMSSDDTWLRRILDNSIGGKISVSEYQTAHSGTYAIIGEEHDLERDGLLRSKLILDPLFRKDKYWILGTSVLGVNTYLGY